MPLLRKRRLEWSQISVLLEPSSPEATGPGAEYAGSTGYGIGSSNSRAQQGASQKIALHTPTSYGKRPVYQHRDVRESGV